jgi:acyl-CoA synthetase (AMP-forming)/AMP-acid ligase II
MSSASIWARFEALARRHGDKPAIVSAGHELTFARLAEAAAGIGAEIADRLGNTPDAPPARIGISCVRAEHGIIALLAIARLRATAVLLDPQRPDAEQRARSIAMECAFHIVDTPRRWTELDILVDLATIPSRAARTPSPVRDDSEPYYVLGTTGTTALPKGVLQSEGNLAAHIDAYVGSIELTTDDRLSLLPALGTDAGFMDAFSALFTGATLYPWDVRTAGLNGIVPWLAVSRISVLHCTPSLLAAILESNTDSVCLGSVRVVVLGGETLHARHLIGFHRLFRPDTRIVNGYGPTECTVVSQAHYRSVDEVIPHNIGKPVPGIEVLIDRGAGSANEVGEIVVVAERVALGYLGADEIER